MCTLQKGIDEELGTRNEWSFAFKNWMCVQDDAYRSDFESVEAATAFVSFESYEPATRSRSLRLYSILATYLKNRPLRILRSVTNGDGYRVWRMLVDELQPLSRPRALALAQALVKFPPYREGGPCWITRSPSSVSSQSTKRSHRLLTMTISRFQPSWQDCQATSRSTWN